MNHTRPHSRWEPMIAMVIVAGLLAACSSGDDDDASAAEAATSTEPASSTAAMTTTAPSTTTAATTTAVAATTAPPASTAPDVAVTAEIQALLEGVLAPGAIAWDCCGADGPPTGASVAVRIPGRDDIVAVAGVNVTGTPVDEGDRFQAGTLNESVLGTIAWQLVDEGVLDPAATIDQWRPDLPNAASVTVSDLLQGTHGWGEFGTLEPDFLADLERYWTLPEVLDVAAQVPPSGAPGVRTGDGSRPAATALAFVVEQVTGSTLADLVATRIAAPLGLEHTVISDGTPEPVGTQDGVFVLPGGTSALDTSMFPHTAYTTFYVASEGARTSVTDLLDLVDAWADGSLFTTERSATPERFLASRPIFEPAPGDFGYTGVAGDGIPFSGYCPCEVQGELVEVTAVGRTPGGLGTDVFALHYLADDITVVLHVNSSEAADRTQLRAVVDAIHSAAAASM